MKTKTQKKEETRMRLKKKVRAQIGGGTQERPRLSVFRSNKYISCQAIDDTAGVTLVSASDLLIKKGTKTERAQEVGKTVGKILKEKGITQVVFDRNGFKYAGRVRSVADAVREAGIKF